MLSTAHLFYIPIIFLVGLAAGYFLGRRAVDLEREEEARRLARREALRQRREQTTQKADQSSSANSS